jgi:hypothetical protein
MQIYKAMLCSQGFGTRPTVCAINQADRNPFKVSHNGDSDSLLGYVLQLQRKMLPPSSGISTLKIEVAGPAQKFTRIYQKTKGLTFSRQWRLFHGLFHDVNISK